MSDTRTSGVRVLIVEDHQIVAEALTEALDAHGRIEVVATAGSLEQARHLVVSTVPDVVLLDVQLPDGDGAAGTADILELAPQTKVVILSALTDIEVIARGVEAGAVGFVSKNEPLEVLRSSVLRAHRGEALFTSQMLAAVVAHLRDRAHRPGRDLTAREHEVLELLAAGESTEDIAERLVLSVHTVRNHVRNLMAKLHARTKLEAVAVALRLRLITPPGAPR